jgi:3-oxoacyl-[acyl-carrier protein] reductase
MKLEGKVALITGAGRGIGRELALCFAKEGADISVSDIDFPSVEETAEEVRKFGQNAIATRADVGDPNDVDNMVNCTLKELGGVHILINNAGILEEGAPIIDSSIERWDNVIRIMLRGTYLCCRRAGQWMVEHKTGKVINLGSVMGLATLLVPRSSYPAAKAGIIHLTRYLASEWAKYNINVNCIAPGYIFTPMTEDMLKKTNQEDKIKELLKRVPLGYVGRPEDIANAALFLVSDEARYITGVTLPVDGGWLVCAEDMSFGANEG